MNSQQNNESKAPGQGVNWPLAFCHFASLPLELLLHDVRTFGIRSVGPRGGGAILIMIVFCACYSHDNGAPLGVLIAATAMLGLTAYINALLRMWRGEREHTRYTGRPYLLALFRLPETTVKRVEPVVVLLVGWGVHHWNRPLGSFLITAAVCLGIRVGIDYMRTQTRAYELNDALAEQTISLQTVNQWGRR